ncbi:hypothetical protein HDE_03507 [Halotydeus destructor]|nr:hypothetical protein HDE_03507 [Halotydeus destructor]
METLGASPSLTKETAATDDDENPPHNVHDAFGKNTLFVTDGQSRVENPVTWPLMDKSSLHNFQWFYDTRFGNIEVTSVGKDEGKWFTACHYYNKIKQRKCYAFAYRGTRGHFKAFEPDEVVWEKSDNTATLQRYGYQRTALAEKVDHQAKLENDKNCKLITKNNKGIPLHLGVIQATGQQVKAIQGTETGHAYLVAVGAAGFIPKDIAQDQVYVPVKPAKSGPNVTVVNGMQLEKILFESGNLCKPVCCLALNTYSYFQSTIWRLTRDVSNVKPSDLSMLEIGVRGRSSQLFPDFNRKSPDFQYRSAMKALTLVRCFVVLVPEALEVDNMVNVVSMQDVHPVQGEMHIVYLIHSSGRYYSQEVYNNVKLVDIDLATSLGRQCLQRLSSLSIQTKTQDGGEGYAKLETMEDGHLVDLPDSKVRGFYNEFWKRVIDPQICHDENQVPLYSRWQHFYRHDFLAQTHLAEPLGNFGPEEIHIVSMANLFQNSQWADTFSFGANINAGERIFLSGAADKNQSATGSPYALYYTYIVQVEVPNDDENIKCIIYDFEGLDDIDVKYHMYEDDGPTKVQACFNEMTKLTWHDKDVPIPERIYFDTTDVFNVRHNQDITVSQTQEDRKHKILATPKKQVIEYKGRQILAEKWSCLTLNQFYFVSHVGIENKVKVGVANVPINCRAYVTHSRSVCEEFVRKAKTTKPAPPGRGKEVDKTGMGTCINLPDQGLHMGRRARARSSVK